MVFQQIKEIDIKDLVLWTENPRDPIKKNANNQDVVKNALEDRSAKWHLNKLVKEMGENYDFSELPTVVYHEKKPVVYDGNRRIILGKLKLGLVSSDKFDKSLLPNFPVKIPCNVCDKDTALVNILRKHANSGSWGILERDIFMHKHMGEGKSDFLIIEEATKLISSHPHMNQRFVKEEVLNKDNLKLLGFDIVDGKLVSTNPSSSVFSIFQDLSKKVEKKDISTRNKRGQVTEVLDKSTRKLIKDNKQNKPDAVCIDLSKKEENSGKVVPKKRKTRRSKKNLNSFFGGDLYLEHGVVNDLYHDISDIYKWYVTKKENLSSSFPNILFMSLRLLCEMAANKSKGSLKCYIESYFDEAKTGLTKDIKTFLSNENVTKASLPQLLQTAAHPYTAAASIEKVIAVSIILGAMLTISHAQSENK
jgi:hypothetical protein